MRLTYSIYLLSIFFFFSCKKEIKIQQQVLVEKKTFTEEDEKVTIRFNKIILHQKALKMVENWNEYQNVATFIPKFYNTTTKEILFNSNQLATLSQQLKDSIRIDFFNTPSFKIRLNVLHNEAMRLFDMDSITSIKNAEIIQENKNIIHAYNAINMKINALVKKEALINDLSKYDHLFKKKNVIISKNEQSGKVKNSLKNKASFNKKRRIKPLSNKKSALKTNEKRN